jgi:hypothetical protein
MTKHDLPLFEFSSRHFALDQPTQDPFHTAKIHFGHSPLSDKEADFPRFSLPSDCSGYGRAA